MKKIFGLLSAILILSNCASDQNQYSNKAPTVENAVAVIHPKNDSQVMGIVNFENTESGVRVSANLSGLTGTSHGFHIHQYGDCTANDGTSAGGHFNPNGNEHAGPDAMNRHMGDMGNISANESGNATLEYIDATISLEQIIGRGIIVHAGTDDLESQPSGAAGPRIGCGVIGMHQ